MGEAHRDGYVIVISDGVEIWGGYGSSKSREPNPTWPSDSRNQRLSLGVVVSSGQRGKSGIHPHDFLYTYQRNTTSETLLWRLYLILLLLKKSFLIDHH